MKLRKQIEDLTILIATAREEGDPDEHKRVVDDILNAFREVLPEKEDVVGNHDLWDFENKGWNDCIEEIESKLK